MKNLLENFAVFLVGLLSLLIIYLIVQYNMIEDQVIPDIDYTIEKKKETKKDYLDSLEAYGEDVYVEVDARQESTVNTVKVRSEEKDDDLGDIVDDKSKESYTKNLEDYYSDKDKKKKFDEAKPDLEDKSGEPQKLEHEEIVDEIGMAIDAALDDL